MSRILYALSVAALASGATLAQAQQPAAPVQTQPGQTQPGQVRPGQPVPGQVQPGQPGRAGQNQPGQAGAHAQGVSLNDFIVHKLKRGNEAEVELGQMAVDRAKSDSVKEFAEMMVKQHQAMIQKLEQQSTRSPDRANRDGAQPAGGTSGQNSSTNNNQPATNQPASNNQPAQPASGQTAGQANAQGHAGGMTGHVPHMLVALTDQSCDNELQLTKQMLEKHEGDDFEMAYIGQQIVAHTCMLAHLQALKNSGPQELQQLASEGEQTTRKHLDHAMKIAKELGEDEKK